MLMTMTVSAKAHRADRKAEMKPTGTTFGTSKVDLIGEQALQP